MEGEEKERRSSVRIRFLAFKIGAYDILVYPNHCHGSTFFISNKKMEANIFHNKSSKTNITVNMWPLDD